ncbi:TPA: hypothetical protein N6828_004877 [Escherichia coli]|nr:hypothetical protein [Escherichia coli]
MLKFKEIHTTCGVCPLPCETSRRAGKDRFAYSLTVVHFRKTVNTQKIGSAENRRPVIYCCGYVSAYYHSENDYGRGKSS